MKSLLFAIRGLKKGSVKKIIGKRIGEFNNNSRYKNKIFSELCFCILTANSTAERCINVQKQIKDGFENLSQNTLQKKLKSLRCRFHTKRTLYIIEARKKKKELFKELQNKDEKEIRKWLVKNIKGIGMKEASHFLRNIGYKNIAIIDFHIIDLLSRYKLIKKPKKLTKEKYFEIENLLKKIAQKLNLTLGELDLYLWFLETGKVLK